MRVLFVTHNFPRHTADVPGNFLLRLARALSHAGIGVEVIAPHESGLAERGEVDGVPVARFRYAPEHRETLAYSGTMAAQVAGSLTAKRDLWRLIRIAQREVSARAASVDVVHAQWWFPSGMAAVRGHRKPVIVTMHGSDVRFGVRSAVGRYLMRRTLRRAAACTAVSEWLATQAAGVTGVEPQVAPMPVATALFTPSTEARSGILFVGKLDPQKGLDVLIDALSTLPASVTLTVVGDGADATRRRAQAAERGVAHRVQWLGALPQRALPELYRRAQLTIAPATEPEGLGLVAVESLLCETPVIASDAGGLRDVVQDGVTGRLVPPRDVRALAGAIAAALAAPGQMEAWGREGRERMMARFTPDACAAVYAELYARTAAAHA